MQDTTISPEELADELLELKRVHDMLDDLRKECNKLTNTAAAIVNFHWVKRGDGEPIRGEISIVTPRIVTEVVPPKPGTPEYEAIVNQFAGSLHEVFDLSWRKLRDQVTVLNEKGEPLPKSLQSLPSKDLYKATCRSKIGEF